MSNYKKTRIGSSHIMLLAVIFVMVVIGTAFYYVVSKNDDKISTSNNSQSNKNDNSNKQTNGNESQNSKTPFQTTYPKANLLNGWSEPAQVSPSKEFDSEYYLKMSSEVEVLSLFKTKSETYSIKLIQYNPDKYTYPLLQYGADFVAKKDPSLMPKQLAYKASSDMWYGYDKVSNQFVELVSVPDTKFVSELKTPNNNKVYLLTFGDAGGLIYSYYFITKDGKSVNLEQTNCLSEIQFPDMDKSLTCTTNESANALPNSQPEILKFIDSLM